MKYYGILPDDMIYTNYRIMLSQIPWLDKYLRGEKIFSPKTPDVKKRIASPLERERFEAEIKKISPNRNKPAKRLKTQNG